jgi:asparagine synthase (glutamine-hydrolysing)
VCGICGFLAPSGVPDAALVEEMNAAIVHRGPDEGSVDAFGRCVLGNRRLSVIDLVTGSQPVENEAGDVVCVFNGEIYDFRNCARPGRSRSRDRRHRRHPVIPTLYEEHGLDFAVRLSGMLPWRLGLPCRAPRACARSVGKKPLLWAAYRQRRLVFASS